MLDHNYIDFFYGMKFADKYYAEWKRYGKNSLSEDQNKQPAKADIGRGSMYDNGGCSFSKIYTLSSYW